MELDWHSCIFYSIDFIKKKKPGNAEPEVSTIILSGLKFSKLINKKSIILDFHFIKFNKKKENWNELKNHV